MARSKLVNADFIEIFHPIGSMGRTVHLPTWKPQELTIHVGKYTSPMQGDSMGYSLWSQKNVCSKTG